MNKIGARLTTDETKTLTPWRDDHPQWFMTYRQQFRRLPVWLINRQKCWKNTRNTHIKIAVRKIYNLFEVPRQMQEKQLEDRDAL